MRAKRSLGQNFLRDEAVVQRIISSLDLSSDDTVFEIGPGRGALTGPLIQEAKRVIAIEFDRDMIAVLTDRFGSRGNFELQQADALNVDFSEFLGPSEKAKLVANLPYNVSTPILQSLIGQRDSFSTIVLMFQREVVERITAHAGGKERGFLSVLVEEAFDTEPLFDVPPTAFTPVPKVWSSVVRLTPKPRSIADHVLFRRLISTAFAQKRKTIFNNLKSQVPGVEGALERSGIDPMRRAESLSLDEWIRLTDVVGERP